MKAILQLGFWVIFLGIALPSFGFDCKSLKNPQYRFEDSGYRSKIDFPEGRVILSQISAKDRGFLYFAEKHANFICSLMGDDQERCQLLSFSTLVKSLQCFKEQDAVSNVRPLTWAYLRLREVEQMLHKHILKTELQKRFWNKHKVLILPAGIQRSFKTLDIKDPMVLKTKDWNDEDLELLDEGFQTLKNAIARNVGKENIEAYSHLWGAGSTISRSDKISVSGQFGQMFWALPPHMQIVIDLKNPNKEKPAAMSVQENKNAIQIAQHIAHEMAHSNDYFRGFTLTGRFQAWSQTEFASIFSICHLNFGYDQSLDSCFRENYSLFNFHTKGWRISKGRVEGTNYAALRSAEFYTKMVDEWVREQIGMVNPGTYRCQSEKHYSLWKEMEFNLMGLTHRPSDNSYHDECRI